MNNLKIRLKKADKEILQNIKVDFLPTGLFQELSLLNRWSKDYLKLSKRFDLIYDVLVKN